MGRCVARVTRRSPARNQLGPPPGPVLVRSEEASRRSSASRSHDVSTAPIEGLPAAERRRLVAIGLLRALAITVLVVAVYYLVPQNNLPRISLCVALAIGLLALSAVGAYQIRAIIPPPHAAVRAVEALAITVPVFLLLRRRVLHDGAGQP